MSYFYELEDEHTHTHWTSDSVCPCLFLSVSVCFCLSVSLSLSVCLDLYVWVGLNLSVCLFLPLSLSLSLCLTPSLCVPLSVPLYVSISLCLYISPFLSKKRTHTHTYNAERSLNSWFESIISNKSGIIHKFVFCLAPTTSSLRIFTNSSLQLSHLSNWLFILLQLFQYQHNGTFYSYCRFCSCRLVRRLPDTSDGWRHRNPISDGSIRNHPSSAERIRPKASSG